MTKIREI